MCGLQIDLDEFLFRVYHPHQMKALTPRQKEILGFIERYLRSRNVPPTLREIADFLGLRHPSTVYRHLQRIAKKGYLILKGGRRGWILVKPFRGGVRIPLYRDLPLPPKGPFFGPAQEWIDLPEWMISDTETPDHLFALRWGEPSSQTSPLQQGDVLIVQAQDELPSPESWVLLYLPEKGLVIRQFIAQRPEGWEVLPIPPTSATSSELLSSPIFLGRVLCILRFPA